MSDDRRLWHVIIDKPRVLGGQMDGATLYGQQLSHHLAACGVAHRGHHFNDLLQIDPPKLFPDGARVLSAAGPYAYLYLYHRELSGANYPIVRDIHAGVWTGYLMQEWLCASLTRPGDVVIYPSFYARDLYRKLFPRVASVARLFVSHPRFAGSDFPAWSPRRQGDDQVNIGYLGRLSKDKNLPDVLAAVAAAREKWAGEKGVVPLVGSPPDMGPADNSALLEK